VSGSGRSRRVSIREHRVPENAFGGAEHLIDGCQIVTEEAAYGENNHRKRSHRGVPLSRRNMRMGHASEVPLAIANRTDAPNIDPRRPAPSAERRLWSPPPTSER